VRILTALLIVTVLGYGIARSSNVYPTVADLEGALNLKRGGQLPKDVQASNGVIYHTYYDGAKELSDGKYAIIVRLGR
jgi:hypothetical protein